MTVGSVHIASQPKDRSWLALAGGLCTLVIAMGIGRFAYTPILPDMQHATAMGHEAAGLLASLNYVGYLAGALAAGLLRPGRSRTRILRLTILASVATTGLMAATDLPAVWGALRLASGLVSGTAFVISADIVIRTLNRHGKGWLTGVHFSGVGLGIAATGLLVPLLGALGGWRGDWLGLCLLSALLAIPALWWLSDDAPQQCPARGPAAGVSLPASAVAAFPLSLLALAYFLEGYGYIVTGTFLVAILQESGNGAALGSLAWTVVGLAAAPACILASIAAARWGYVAVLVAAYLLQAVGIILPVLSTALVPTLIAAILFGATFMAITTLVVAFGRAIVPAAPARSIALLTAAFGLGQIFGPTAAGWLADRSGSFDSSLVMAVVVLLAGAAMIGVGPFLKRTTASQASS